MKNTIKKLEDKKDMVTSFLHDIEDISIKLGELDIYAIHNQLEDIYILLVHEQKRLDQKIKECRHHQIVSELEELIILTSEEYQKPEEWRLNVASSKLQDLSIILKKYTI